MIEVRRQFERHPCDIEVGVIGNNGEAVLSETFDISEEGINLMLPVSSVVDLMESGSKLASGEILDILLPNHDQSIDLQISSTIVHSKALVNGSYMLGIQFQEWNDETRLHIADLIKSLKLVSNQKISGFY